MIRLALLLLLVSVSLAAAADALDDEMNRLAAERGCTFCHAARPAQRVGEAVPPPAPPWSDISKRYKGRPGAEDKLVALVVHGSEPGNRHWPVTSTVAMPANRVVVADISEAQDTTGRRAQ